MKKILFIMQLPPPLHGASQINYYVANSSAINNSFNTQYINLQFAKSVSELRRFSVKKIARALKYLFIISYKIIIFKPELIYYTISPTGLAFYRDAFYVFILKFFNAKILLHLHGKGIKKNINTLIKRNIYKWVFYKTYVICLSETLSGDIADVYKGIPFIVANGVSEQTFRRCEQTSIAKLVPQILYLSNYHKNKGILVLVEALGILKTRGYNFTASFVGGTSDITIEMLENLIKEQDLTTNAKVTGPLYGEDKYLEFQKADLFVFPTYNDAFPLVTIEAMQFGLPVVSTYEGSVPDIVINNETGFLVEKQNAQMLADKVAILLENKELRIAMGKKGYERFINHYTLNHFENNMSMIFSEILGTN